MFYVFYFEKKTKGVSLVLLFGEPRETPVCVKIGNINLKNSRRTIKCKKL